MDAAFANRLWTETGLRELVCGTKDERHDEDAMSQEHRTDLWLEDFVVVDNLGGLSICRGGEPVGLNPSIRIYRYNKGQYFDRHCSLSHSFNVRWLMFVP